MGADHVSALGSPRADELADAAKVCRDTLDGLGPRDSAPFAACSNHQTRDAVDGACEVENVADFNAQVSLAYGCIKARPELHNTAFAPALGRMDPSAVFPRDQKIGSAEVGENRGSGQLRFGAKEAVHIAHAGSITIDSARPTYSPEGNDVSQLTLLYPVGRRRESPAVFFIAVLGGRITSHPPKELLPAASSRLERSIHSMSQFRLLSARRISRVCSKVAFRDPPPDPGQIAGADCARGGRE